MDQEEMINRMFDSNQLTNNTILIMKTKTLILNYAIWNTVTILVIDILIEVPNPPPPQLKN